MKYMFASDVHGSAYYCRKMLDVYKEEKAERVKILLDTMHCWAICSIMAREMIFPENMLPNRSFPCLMT